MFPRSIARYVVRLAGASLSVCLLTQCGEPAIVIDGPDIVLIVVDTMRADALLDPSGNIDTPRIDELARDGVVFPKAYSHAPMTLPSHASLFSSRPPVETGVFNNGQVVPRRLPLLAEWLGKHGYFTSAVVSLGTLRPVEGQGLNRGFDEYIADFWQILPADKAAPAVTAAIEALPSDRSSFLFAHYCDPHEPYTAHGTVTRSARILLDGKEIGTLPLSDLKPIDLWLDLARGRHTLEGISEHTFFPQSVLLFDNKSQGIRINWETEKRKAGTQFRTSFNVRAGGMHHLLIRGKDKIDHAELVRRYILEIEFVDSYVGRLLDELRAAGRYDSSLIIFTSDHGESLGERGWIGHVQSLHAEMLHVPLIVKPPVGYGKTEALAAAREFLAAQVNIVPTILQIVGVPPLPGQRGVSLLESKRPTLLAQTHKPEAKRNLISFRDEEFMLVLDIDADTFEMFDLAEDPAEVKNIFAARSAERESWIESLRRLGKTSLEGTRGEASGSLAEDLAALGYGGADDDED